MVVSLRCTNDQEIGSNQPVTIETFFRNRDHRHASSAAIRADLLRATEVSLERGAGSHDLFGDSFGSHQMARALADWPTIARTEPR